MRELFLLHVNLIYSRSGQTNEFFVWLEDEVGVSVYHRVFRLQISQECLVGDWDGNDGVYVCMDDESTFLTPSSFFSVHSVVVWTQSYV